MTKSYLFINYAVASASLPLDSFCPFSTSFWSTYIWHFSFSSSSHSFISTGFSLLLASSAFLASIFANCKTENKIANCILTKDVVRGIQNYRDPIYHFQNLSKEILPFIKPEATTLFHNCHDLVKIQPNQYYALFWDLFNAAKIGNLSKNVAEKPCSSELKKDLISQ